MVFSSAAFLFVFLPAVWAVYTLIPKRFLKAKNFLLAAASLIFYAFGEPVYVIIMIASVTVNYFAARAIDAAVRARKAIVVLSVIVNLSLLFLFKYVPWLTGVANSALGIALPVPALTIPVGISFYTFQILSYVIDVYRKRCAVQKNYLDLFLYISFFPQLIAGPIVKYGDIADQIAQREMTAEKTARGIKRFIFGLSKKILISNSAALIADAAFASGALSTAFAWTGAICYCLQLYFDFSGYSDMAIGLAGMFGFSLGENFNYPYAATSIRDFWKRWHISLTSWFREYVYFPLGGNRRGKARTILNRLVIFFLTGAWHGANFTYIIWGMWHGALMMFEESVGFDRFEKKRGLRVLTRIYTLVSVCVGFVMFRAPRVSVGLSYIASMFTFTPGTLGFETLSPWIVAALVCGIVFSVPVVPRLVNGVGGKYPRLLEAASYALCCPLLVLSVMFLVSSAFNPFIYYIF